MLRYEKVASNWKEFWESVCHARKTGRLGHAFLISSYVPESREDFAIALAMLAACPEAPKNGVPCGKCLSCQQLENETYPELYHLYPVGRGYQIQVGDRRDPEPNTVRYFEKQFHLTSTSGADRKIGIIHDADRMNSEAQNALLKTLEEPPRDTMIILTTGNPSALLPTTRSRCQLISLLENRVEFDFAGADELFDTLHELFFSPERNLATGEVAAEKIIKISGALRGDAETAMSEEWEDRIARAKEMESNLATRLERQRDSAAAGIFMKERRKFISAIESYFSQLYVLASGGTVGRLPNPEIMKADLGEIKFERAKLALNEANSLRFNLLFNINESLALRNFSLQVALAE